VLQFPHSSLLLLIMITKGVAQVCVPDVSPPLSYTRVFPHCLEVGTKQWATSVVVADDEMILIERLVEW